MYFSLRKCRACGSSDLTPVFDLGVQPLANDFHLPDEPSAGYAPLQVLFCQTCTLGQLSVVVDPAILYRDYPYITSRSETMANHFDSLCNDILAETGPGSVIEIGSNDGHFLSALHRSAFHPVIGVDPAENLCTKARELNFNVVCGQWGNIAASQCKNFISKPVDVVVARHVFCHVHEWRAFIEALDLVTHRNSLVCIEVPYAPDMLQRVEFDTIYHEHLSYFTLRAMDALLTDSNWYIHNVKRYPVHGGTIVVMLRNRLTSVQHTTEGSPLVQKMIHEETNETSGDGAWELFKKRSWVKIQRLRDICRQRAQVNHMVCGFGASAKSTVWIHAAELQGDIAFISDNTPQKIGRLSPGTRIPIIDEQAFLERKSEAAVLFAWNYAAEIVDRMSTYKGEFIVP